jgi:4-hydroxy-tetrahydrodipicolinate synthase
LTQPWRFSNFNPKLPEKTSTKGDKMKPGCYTALATPFTPDGMRIDQKGLEQLVAFQIAGGITGILAVGTTGESPTLAWNEHNAVVDTVARLSRNNCLCIAGAGSNNTQEALNATEHAVRRQVDAVLLVDPYYNGPSSLEIRREYVAPIAKQFPGVEIIPYVIPGRTGAQLLPQDLALLFEAYPNVSGVKEATADLDNMRRTRECCGKNFVILSGDDAMTYDMMTDPAIAASGVISVLSNIAPRAVSQMTAKLIAGDRDGASALLKRLEPLFNLVTVKTTESTPHGDVVCRARNPLALKTLMRLLGMPSGPCRAPLGKMTRKGLDVVLDAARKVWTENPDILKPAGDFFGVNIAERLDDPQYQDGLSYADY